MCYTQIEEFEVGMREQVFRRVKNRKRENMLALENLGLSNLVAEDFEKHNIVNKAVDLDSKLI